MVPARRRPFGDEIALLAVYGGVAGYLFRFLLSGCHWIIVRVGRDGRPGLMAWYAVRQPLRRLATVRWHGQTAASRGAP